MSTFLGDFRMGGETRDAIHIAIAPAIAAENLFPGQSVGLVAPEKSVELMGPCPRNIGIVDPFLTVPVMKGDLFWVCLFPNTVTGMRHHWEHPDFAAEALTQARLKLTEKATEYLASLSKRTGVDYDDLIEAGQRYVESGDYFGINFDTPQELYDERAQYWWAIEILTDSKPSDEDKTSVPFSCAC